MTDRDPGSDEDLNALVDHVISLGGTADEIERAARVGGLGPLALDLAMRPEGLSVPFETFLAETHVDPDQVRRLWTALGLPESPPMPCPVTADVAKAIEASAFLTQHLGEERVLGLRDSCRGRAPTDRHRHAVLRGGTQLQLGRARAAAVLWDAIGAVLRRHLVLVSYQRWSTDDERIAVRSNALSASSTSWVAPRSCGRCPSARWPHSRLSREAHR